MAEQDALSRTLSPADAHPEVDPAAVMFSAAEDLDFSNQTGHERNNSGTANHADTDSLDALHKLNSINGGRHSTETAASSATYGQEGSHTEHTNSQDFSNVQLSATALVPRFRVACPPYPFCSRPGYRAYHAQKEAAWSADGRCILHLAEDMCLRTHMTFPPKFRLVGVHEAPESIATFAAYPYFNCTDWTSMLAIASVGEEPLRLLNVNDENSPVRASYHLMRDTDDVTYIQADCLKFLHDRQRFVAAGENCIAIFDVERYSQRPQTQLYTHGKARRKRMGNPVALSSTISSIDYRADGLLAVGTWGNRIGFYEMYGAGAVVSVERLDSMRDSSYGYGVQSVRWSPDGNYLYVVERNSDVVIILDVRMAGRTVSFLTGRNAMSNQRHGFDLMTDGGDDHNVIAGGSDGVVRIWKNPTKSPGEMIQPDSEWQAHSDAISSVAVNPFFSDCLMTTTGSRRYPTEEDYDTSSSSSSDSSSSDGDEEDEGMDSDGDDEDADMDNVSEETSSSSGGAKELDSPVPKGWLKLWRWH